ncbi:hypothetical protein SX4_3741 [Vibrio mimicus SX-4]|nr:hypothetical protein SX4_3741 [Vibrio mimicus SX-4]
MLAGRDFPRLIVCAKDNYLLMQAVLMGNFSPNTVLTARFTLDSQSVFVAMVYSR